VHTKNEEAYKQKMKNVTMTNKSYKQELSLYLSKTNENDVCTHASLNTLVVGGLYYLRSSKCHIMY
jgi:dihydroorotase